MSAFDSILADFAALKAKVTAEATTLRLGTYQADGSVLLPDGAALTPAAVLAYVETGDTVLVGHHLRRAWVLGKVSPDGPPDPYEPPDPVMRMQAGQATVNLFTNDTTSITFSPAFPAAPRVLVTLVTDPDGVAVFANVDSVSTTGATIRLRCPTNWGGAFVFNWLAVPDGSLTI